VTPIAIRAQELVGDLAVFTAQADGSELITLSDDSITFPNEVRKFWAVVLLMAVRDRVTSVQYHPWGGARALGYVVDNVRYDMNPPPAEFADRILEAARELFTEPVGPRRDQSACSSFVFDSWGLSVEWDVVCWSNGERSGVEFFRVTPLESLTGQ
jgi:hypothetical protein